MKIVYGSWVSRSKIRHYGVSVERIVEAEKAIE